jgi:hypothetical protein
VFVVMLYPATSRFGVLGLAVLRGGLTIAFHLVMVGIFLRFVESESSGQRNHSSPEIYVPLSPDS